jgi:hypothetical protein
LSLTSLLKVLSFTKHPVVTDLLRWYAFKRRKVYEFRATGAADLTRQQCGRYGDQRKKFSKTDWLRQNFSKNPPGCRPLARLNE